MEGLQQLGQGIKIGHHQETGPRDKYPECSPVHENFSRGKGYRENHCLHEIENRIDGPREDHHMDQFLRAGFQRMQQIIQNEKVNKPLSHECDKKVLPVKKISAKHTEDHCDKNQRYFDVKIFMKAGRAVIDL